MLPNEQLLDVLHFADYGTLVTAKLARTCFLHVVTRFAEELARRRSFEVKFIDDDIECNDVTIGALRTFKWKPGNMPTFAAACREAAEMIGPHAVTKLMFYSHTWTHYESIIFEAAPALKYAADVELYSPDDWFARDAEDHHFLSNFAGVKSLSLHFDDDYYWHTKWELVCHESASTLRHIKVRCVPATLTEHMDRSVEELIHQCATLPRLLRGEALDLDFSENYFSGAFGLRIIELLKGCGCEVTFRMMTRQDEGELTLNENDYTVDFYNTTTRYASDERGIVVEVNGRLVTIKSTVDVPRKKPRAVQ